MVACNGLTGAGKYKIAVSAKFNDTGNNMKIIVLF
jgi:hypothetical protein